ncbi:MAG: UvrD-helicase domain-containing protein [Anaerolineae bacterium]
MNILDSLNEAQREAVQAIEGAVLVLAGPGSGKTRVLTHHAAYLIDVVGVDPYHIMAVTFTNKAAREMRDRLHHLVGERRLGRLTLGTFHATCARILRREAEYLHVGSNFVIFDTDDQLRLIREAVKELDLNDKLYRPRQLKGAISKAKNELIGPGEYAAPTYWHEIAARVYQHYQSLLQTNNALDFDDLLMEAVRLLRQHPDVRDKYRHRYQHILVDEFQDTNTAQYDLVRQLAGDRNHVFVVGDEDQCVPGDTLIATSDGSEAIQSLPQDTSVRVAAGRSVKMETVNWERRSREYEGPVVTIKTSQGYRLTTTPQHMMFARLGEIEDAFYVYLMYKHDVGYRIGLVQSARRDGSRNELLSSLAVRGDQEKADKVWILKVCRTRPEAFIWEQYYAFQYGIPTTVFFTDGRDMALEESLIDKLYRRIDTTTRAEQLMEDLFISPYHPHHRPKGIAGDRQPTRVAVQFQMFGDTRRTSASPWNAHRVSINTSDLDLKQKTIKRGYDPRPARRGSWKLEWSNLDCGIALQLAEEIAQAGGGLEIAYSAFLTDTKTKGGITRRFDFHPASHLHPGMTTPIEVDGHIVDDEIVEVDWGTFSGSVYDLNVDKVHNYIANGIVVHNSIYRWRGADFRNVQRFRRDFEDAQVFLLERNYRSTQTILDAAREVISRNTRRTPKDLWTNKGAGIPITVKELYDEQEEASFVANEIQRLMATDSYDPGDFAVMYRTNAQSRVVEEAFLRQGMRYRLVGATRFYERREIKDLIAYMRLIHNPLDQVSLDRVINVPPRGIGHVTLSALARWARKLNLPIYEALHVLRRMESGKGKKGKSGKGRLEDEIQSPISNLQSPFDTRATNVLLEFVDMIEELIAAKSELTVPELLGRAIEATGYESYIRDGTEKGEDRWANIQELRGVAQEYAGLVPEVGLPAFLEGVALVSDVDNLDANADAPTLMTCHAAKGLEFPVVFLVGMEEGLLPHSRSMDDPAQMEEERRLCYVGITRAKERLYLLHTFRRNLWGRTEVSDPSRFLKDIPSHLIKGKSAQAGRGEASGTNGLLAWQDPTPLASPLQHEPEFRAGDRVRHHTFGEGVVVESRLSHGDEEVEIAFVGQGVKKLLASLAKLEKLA